MFKQQRPTAAGRPETRGSPAKAMGNLAMRGGPQGGSQSRQIPISSKGPRPGSNNMHMGVRPGRSAISKFTRQSHADKLARPLIAPPRLRKGPHGASRGDPLDEQLRGFLGKGRPAAGAKGYMAPLRAALMHYTKLSYNGWDFVDDYDPQIKQLGRVIEELKMNKQCTVGGRPMRP